MAYSPFNQSEARRYLAGFASLFPTWWFSAISFYSRGKLTVLDGCLLPISVRAMEWQLKAQQQELEQVKQRMTEMLA
ncbi:hypothetical protein [Erwinia tasmaniensis]|uniref:Uncharacterized protein n=1 Tax=Erwinia tasmaniensis (strain DSM 17950 / CFBP 7177 / CIP 109463 / NCPPB 4357 / Et1/99) TaxID=465817 RepID=B2VH68_ERWT9|nr:hypothetical protein [Erwinia tasmaniensis]CAO95697.1 hypothetical protein ETA_06510 [Erwinia tasmaniensis Et1/99]